MSSLLVIEPEGGLGNRLFTLHFAAQIAEQLRIRVAVVGKSYEHLWLAQSPERRSFRARARSSIRINSKDVGARSPDLLESFADLFMEHSNVVIRGPVLGEAFFKTCFRDPKGIFDQYPALHRTPEQRSIAVHFRGTDFRQWNAKALLPVSYYMEAYERHASDVSSDPLVEIVTDDMSLESVSAFIKHLQQKSIRWTLSDPNLSLLVDFERLRRSTVLISSPSTFAIWAGILGDTRVVHSREWVMDRAAKGDRFWQELLDGGNQYYSLMSLT